MMTEAFQSVLPDLGAAGLLTLIWRFIDLYLGLLAGGAAFLLIMRDIGRGRRVAAPENPERERTAPRVFNG